jgi:hypothetical protein
MSKMKKILKPKKCKAPSCGKEFIPFSSLAKACCVGCSLELTRELNKIKAAKEYNQETKRLKEKVKKRSAWYDDLQTLVNQYVVHVRDKNEGCCTCGKRSNVKYDAGHYLSRGAYKELRFELTNIHKQCSVNCNQHGSGMRVEYNAFIKETYGEDHYNWLNGPHKLLKDQFPHYLDIKEEINKYRKLLRENGIKPKI